MRRNRVKYGFVSVFAILIVLSFSFNVFAAENSTAIGEWGHETNLNSSWRWIDFSHTFNNTPVVIHQAEYDYDYDDNPCSTRIYNVNETGFYLRSESWDSGTWDNDCPTTGVGSYWMAMEEGIYEIVNKDNTSNRIVEVESFSMSNSACFDGASGAYNFGINERTLLYSWSNRPLIWHSIQTADDNDTITTYSSSCGNNLNTWSDTCVEIGLNGLECDGTFDPCASHTSDETGGYIAWEIANSYNSENCYTYETGNSTEEYTYEICWESDNVLGSSNDGYDIGNYYVTLDKSYSDGACIGSNTEIDGANGLFPVVDYDAGSNKCYFLAEEDQNGDEEQTHTTEPWMAVFFNASSGIIFKSVTGSIVYNAPVSVNSASIVEEGIGGTLNDLNVSYSVSDAEGDDFSVRNYWNKAGVRLMDYMAPFEYGSSDTSTITIHKGSRLPVTVSATWQETGGVNGEGAYDFDGSTNYINIDNGVSNSIFDETFTDRTVAMWYNADSVSGSTYRMLYEEGGTTNGANIYIYNGYVYVGAWSESDSWTGKWIAKATTASAWHFVALIFDGTNNEIEIYYDGDHQVQSITGNRVYSHSGNEAIGRTQDNTVASPNSGTDRSATGDYFSGKIDEFLVFNVALTSGQLEQYYNGSMYMLDSSMTTKGESWTSTVVAFDNQTKTDTKITSSFTIKNTPPTMSTVLVDDDFSIPGSVDLTPFSYSNAYCTGVANDVDGGAEVSSGSGYIYRSDITSADLDAYINHYTNSSCTADSSYGNTNESLINCTFPLIFYAEAGEWECEITGVDVDSGSGVDVGFANVTEVLGIDVQVGDLDFGSLAIGETTGTIDYTRIIYNGGNVNLSLKLNNWGFAFGDGNSMSCAIGTLDDRNLRVAMVPAESYASKTQLQSTNDDGTILSGFMIEPQTSGTTPSFKTLHFGMGINSSETPSGDCYGNLMFTGYES